MRVTLTGDEPQLPSSFRVDAAAQVAIAASGLAAAEIWRLRSGQAQHVASTCATPWSNAAPSAICASTTSRRRRSGTRSPASTRSRDGRFVRLHTNFPHHRDAVCKVLNCAPERDAVQAALLQWDGEAFETAAYAAGGVVALMRSRDAMDGAAAGRRARGIAADRNHQDRRRRAKTVARRRAAARGPARARSVAGDRGSGGRPHARGARRRRDAGIEPQSAGDPVAHASTPAAASCRALSIWRPSRAATRCAICCAAPISSRKAIGRNRSPRSASRRRTPRRINPGIVYVSLSAYGRSGPWAGRRGFDSLVQCATGFNHAEGEAAGVDGPKELPTQILDHATGYLMAFGAMMARGAPGARRRQLACRGVAGADRAVAVGDGPARRTD